MSGTNVFLMRHSVPAEISCFHDYGEELALNLFIIFKLEETIAKSDTNREISRVKLVILAVCYQLTQLKKQPEKIQA